MAQLTIKERKDKGIALSNAFDLLEAESISVGKNLITYKSVCEYANASDIVKNYTTSIGISTLKTSKEPAFMVIREKIIDYRKNFKNYKDHIDFKQKEQIQSLEDKVSDLLTKIVIFEESNNRKKQEINFLQSYNSKIKEERDRYFSELNKGVP